jgi:hypothetical protein
VRRGGSDASRSDQIELWGEVHARTDRAVLWYDGDKEVWLPLSQIELADDQKSILIGEWLAVDKGLV